MGLHRGWSQSVQAIGKLRE